jgi:hypothetical protein
MLVDIKRGHEIEKDHSISTTSSVTVSPLVKLRQRIPLQLAVPEPVPSFQSSGPDTIVDLVLSFRASQALMTAIKLDIFSILTTADHSHMTSSQLASSLRLNAFAANDFFDLLVSMNLLHRHGSGPSAEYSNTVESRMYLTPGRDSHIGDLLLKCDDYYKDWIGLDELLKRENKQDASLRIGEVMERDMRAAKERVMAGQSGIIEDDSDADDEPFTWGLTVEDIFKIAYSFAPAKAVLVFLQMELFSYLAKNEDQTASQLGKHLNVDERKLDRCLAMLVGYKILVRRLVGKKIVYNNSPAAATYLVKESESYIGGALDIEGQYKLWPQLQKAMSRSETTASYSKSWLETHYTHIGTDSYYRSTQQINCKAFHKFAESFDFGMRRTMIDLGGGTGQLSAIVAEQNRRMRCITSDLPHVAKKSSFPSCGRVVSMGLDFIEDIIPRADVVTMAHVFNECSVKEKELLVSKAFHSLPLGGALVLIDRILDDERRHCSKELASSLNVLLERGVADERYGYSYTDFCHWTTSVGFQRTDLIFLGSGLHAALIAYK